MRIPRNPYGTLDRPPWSAQAVRDHRALDLAFGLRRLVIPEPLHAAVTEYVVNRRLVDRRQPGRFLVALLQNDLRAAVTLADLENEIALGRWITLLTEYVPAECWGSPERVSAWLEGVETP